MKPIVIDLFCGLGGWSEGFLAAGYRCIGFDVERHDYGSGGYPGELVLQDVLTLHGSQFKNAACIVASPPCQEFSYMAMPWRRAKQIAMTLREEPDRNGNFADFPPGYTGSRTLPQLTALFDACFRIQREAIEATRQRCSNCLGWELTFCPICRGEGTVTRHIPLVVENVKGAQPWVGRAQANYGSFYLWGDVRSVGGRIVAAHRVEFGAPVVKAGRAQKSNPDGTKNSGGSWFNVVHNTDSGLANNPVSVPAGRKVPMNFHEHEKTGKPGRSFQSAAVESQKQPVWFNDDKRRATKCGGDWFWPGENCSLMRSMGSKSNARKAASAEIARIPFALSEYIARAFKPDAEAAA